MIMKSLYIEIRSRNDNSTYPTLVADLGYCQRVLTYDKGIILELSPEPAYELLSRPAGSKIEVI